MKSQIIHGRLYHGRMQPVRHTFEYPVFFFRLDTDELETLSRQSRFFSLNRWNVFSLREKDYLNPGSGTLREKVSAVLAVHGIGAPAAIELVTQLRYFGWVFNPVSFFFCRDAAGNLSAVIADVNNTFGEGHAYVLTDLKNIGNGGLAAHAEKVFHVSPFFEKKGEYRFEFFLSFGKTRIVLDYFHDGALQIAASWEGAERVWTNRMLLSTVLKYPFGGWLTMFRIHFQAAVLYFVKKLPVFKKPEPDHPMTLRKRMPC